MKKKLIMLALALVTVFSFTACGEKNIDFQKRDASVADLSSNWKDMQFLLGGKLYKVPFTYIELASEGWSYIDAAENVNAGAKLPSIPLANPYYNNQTSIGIVNNLDRAADGSECTVYKFEMNIKESLSVDEIHIAGGLRWGSSMDEIKSAWGDPTSVNKSNGSDDVKFNYYDAEKNISVDLLISKTTGLYGVCYEAN